ncbi:MAG: hypothetical protein ACTSYD_12350 [Candidatus Heimdallarchaeaceae archaeon]
MKGKISTFILCAIILCIPFVQAFSIAVPGRYVISLEKDQVISKAIDTIHDQVPDIKEITYGSIRYYLLSNRIIEPLVWVGHGNDDGINSAEGKITWESFAQDISASPASDIVLSCYSSELYKQELLTKQDVITFNEEIDATLGGLITAWFITSDITILQRAIDYSFSLQSKDASYEALIDLDPGLDGGTGGSMSLPSSYSELSNSFYQSNYVFLKLSGVELAFHLVMLGVLILQILFAIYVSPNLSIFQEYAESFFLLGTVQLLTTAYLYQIGLMTTNEAVSNIAGACFDSLDALWDAICHAPAGEIALLLVYLGIAVVLTIGQLIVDTQTAGLATFL